MKVHGHRIMLYGLIMVVIMIGIGLSLKESNYYFFKIDFPQFAVVPSGSGELNYGSVLCYTKVSNEKVIDGKTFSTAQSVFYSANPKFDLLDSTTGKSVDEFKVIPKIKCNLLPTGDKESAGVTRTITVNPSELILTVYSKDSNNHLVKTHEERKTTTKITLTDKKEGGMTTFTVKPDSLAEDLPVGSYPSLQEFRISGTLKLYYDIKTKTNSYPLNLQLYIAEDKIKTWQDMKITNIEKSVPKPSCEIDNSCEAPPKQTEPTSNNIVAITDIFIEFATCATSLDLDCLSQQKFFPIYAVLVVGITITVIATRPKQTGIIGV